MVKNEIKVLLSGAGESGNVRRWNPYTDRCSLNVFPPQSTVLKQMKLITKPFSSSSRVELAVVLLVDIQLGAIRPPYSRRKV